MYTLSDLNPSPVRLCPTGGGGSSWSKSGRGKVRCIIRDNNPPPQSRGRVTPDDWEEGGRNWTDRLFLESPVLGSPTLEASAIVKAVTNNRNKKPYTLKNKPPISTGGVNGRGFGPKRT